MVSVYLDWGVISELRKDNYPELETILFQSDKFLVPYSQSHINDLLPKNNSELINEYLNMDLEYLSRISKNNLLTFSNSMDILEQKEPKELYQKSIEAVSNFEEFNLAILNELINESDDLLKSILERFKEIPIPEKFVLLLNENEALNKFFPGLKKNPNFDGLFRCLMVVIERFDRTDDYKIIREKIQNSFGINRDKMFTEKEPFNAIREAHEKKGFDLIEYLDDKESFYPKWVEDMIQDYLILDLHGFAEDRIDVKKGRKQTIRNLKEDAFHATHASVCDFYILKDKKAFEKTKKIYEKWNIKTIPIKPEQFIDYAYHNIYPRSK
jgi:hypothetical protein